MTGDLQDVLGRRKGLFEVGLTTEHISFQVGGFLEALCSFQF